MHGGHATIHLIRHGDALAEPSERRAYDDRGLSEVGRRQTAALAERLSAYRYAPIYTSPIRRAVETAALLAAVLSGPVREDPRLGEVSLGAALQTVLADGTSMRERIDALGAAAMRDGSWKTVAAAEAGRSVRDRMTASIEQIARAHIDEHVFVVSHAGAINAFFADILAIDRDFFFPTENTSISTVRAGGGRTTLVRLNDAAHLEGLFYSE